MGIPSKILVRTPNWIGDHVMALEFYRKLVQVYPHSKIDLIGPEPVISLDLEMSVNKKIVLPIQARHVGLDLFHLGLQLREEQYELSFSLPATLGGCVLPFLAGVPYRIGFFKDGTRLFLTSGCKWLGNESKLHKSEIYLGLLDYVGLHSFQSSTVSPPLDLSGQKYLIVAPGASIDLRVWPYFDELLSNLSQKIPVKVVGGEREKGWNQKLQKYSPERVENWIGKTTLNELVSLCKESVGVIANDSGVAHLAATLAGVPTFVLFGPGDPRYIVPRGPSVTVLKESPPCSPCEKPYCRAAFGYQICLKNLSAERVTSTVIHKLSL